MYREPSLRSLSYPRVVSSYTRPWPSPEHTDVLAQNSFFLNLLFVNALLSESMG